MESSQKPPENSSDSHHATLQESELKYRNLVETCNDLIWSVDAEGRWTFLNRHATLQIYGYEPEEMLGRPFTDFEPPEQIEKDLQAFSQVKSGVPHFKYETIHLRKEGRPVYLSFNAIVLKNSQNQVIGATGTATDITELKKSELALKAKSNLLTEQQSALLRLSKMDFSSLESSINEITETSARLLNTERVSFWLYNQEKTEIQCQDLYRYSVHQHHSGIFLKSTDYPMYFKALDENLLLTVEDARRDSRTKEFTEGYLIPHNIYSMLDIPVRLNGKVVGVLCHEHVGYPRKWKEEEQDFVTSISGMISIALLISQLRETEKALQQKTQALESSNKSLEEFAYIASHDLQEPLYIITAFLDKIKDQHASSLPTSVSSLIDRIYNAALRMNHLIRDLFNYAKVNIRKKPFEEVDLKPLIQEVWESLDLRVQETGAKLHLESLTSVRADKSQIHQLFFNLLSNALKFKKEGQAPQIHISSKSISNDKIEITVEDNGIGFEQEFVDKIFLPFQRLHTRNFFEGSGMGLAICQKIVEKHQGKIEAVSELNQGTKFIITLPRKGNSPSL